MTELRNGAGVYVSYPDWPVDRIDRFLYLCKTSLVSYVLVQTHNGGSELDPAIVSRWIAACQRHGVAFGLWGVTYTEPEIEARVHARHIRLYQPKIAAIDAELHYMGDPRQGGDQAIRWDRNLRYLRTFDQELPATSTALVLSTLGAASGQNVYWMPHNLWQVRHDVHAQAYFNAYDDYRPDLCVAHWVRAGWPVEKIKLTLGCYQAEAGSKGLNLRLADYLPLLKGLAVKGVQLYQAEALVDDDVRNASRLVTGGWADAPPAPTPPPPPPPSFDVPAARALALAQMGATIDYWRSTGLNPDALSFQRQTSAWRMLNVAQTKANLVAIRDLLDRLGAPKP